MSARTYYPEETEMIRIPHKLGIAAVGAVILVMTLTDYASPRADAAAHTQAVRTNGDIPDTATYLTYHGPGFSVKYVEGWGILKLRQGVQISDKDTSETVSISHTKTGVASAAGTDVSRFKHSLPQFRLLARRTVRLQPGSAVYLQYRTLSAQDPVTGKRVPVVVDRYYVPGAGRQAVISLSTPVGVDNVDAFRLIARSFRWS
jgi:hypothetical protein